MREREKCARKDENRSKRQRNRKKERYLQKGTKSETLKQ